MAKHNLISNNGGDIRDILFENLFDVQSDGNLNFYNLSQGLSIEGELAPDFFFEHFYVGENWYQLSNQFYNTPELYWAILVVNNIKNPFVKPENGTIIKIPTSNFVQGMISLINDQETCFPDEP